MAEPRVRLAIVGWRDDGRPIKAFVDDDDQIVEYEREFIERVSAERHAAEEE